MARIAVLIADMFQDDEYERPAEAFRNAGHEITLVGLASGATVKGKRGIVTARVELAAKDVSVSDFDALLIPGGYSPDNLKGDKDVVRLVRDIAGSGKPVFAICHGPRVLIAAGSVRGRRLTGWIPIAEEIKASGGTYVNAEVVVDGNMVTSRRPADLPAFINATLDMLKKRRA